MTFACLGCTVKQVDIDPMPMTPRADRYVAGEQEGHAPEIPWWLAFDDPALSALIEQGLLENLTLRQGLERIEQASAFLRQAGAAGKPVISLESGVTREWDKLLNPESPEVDPIEITVPDTTGANKQAGSGGTGSGSGGARDGAGEPDTEQWQSAYDAGLSLRWELDLWGKFRSRTDARREELQASIQDYESLRLTLSRQIADTYYAAVEQRLRLALLEEQQKIYNTSLELLELRLLQGDTTAVDILQQQSQAAEIDTERPVVLAALGALENRLDILLGLPPDGQDRTALDTARLTQSARLPTLSVPAQLLAQRPDLKALQRRLVADDYEIAAAMAERYPSVALTGSFSYTGVVEGDRNLGGSMAAGLLQPLLDWGARKAAVDATKAEFRETLYAFSEAYLIAIEEVETALWQEARQRERIAALEAREAILLQTVGEARVRYGLGVNDYLPVLNAQEQLNTVQRELLAARRDAVLLRVQLHAAAGGATGVLTSAPIVEE